MSTLINKNAARRVQYKIDENKTEIMFPNDECLSAALLRELLPSGSAPAGDSAYITDASDLVPVESLKVNIQPVQAGSGDPSPENVRAISGWYTVKVTRTGKNLLEFPYDNYKPGNYTVNGVTFAISSDGTIATSGTGGTAGNYSAQVFIGRYNGKDIAGKILTGCPSGGSNNKYRIIVQHYGSPWNIYVSDYGTGAVIPDTVKDDDNVGIAVQIYKEINADGLIFKPMLRNAADADASFEPYQGESHSIPLGRTVYGGTLDVTTGELVVDSVEQTFTAFSSKSGTNANNAYTITTVANIIKKPSADSVKLNGLISNEFEVYKFGGAGGIYSTDVKGISVNVNGTIIVGLGLSGASTLADANAWLAENPLQVVYPLAAPQTYTLTPQQVTLLKGINNIFADAGTVEVQYSADIQLYIDSQIAETQALVLEN